MIFLQPIGLSQCRISIIRGYLPIAGIRKTYFIISLLCGIILIPIPLRILLLMTGNNAGSGSHLSTCMNININGNIVEKAFSPGEESGVKTIVKRRYNAEAGDLGIFISFIPGEGATHFSAIKIRKL